MRPPMRTHQLDHDILLDCDLAAVRVPVWRDQKSI
jgi:hypothetical protein